MLKFHRLTGDLVMSMRECPQPIIAGVDGICAGAGAIIAMASDFRFCTPEARTAFLFVRVGWRAATWGLAPYCRASSGRDVRPNFSIAAAR